jgi:imidazolonepropionase-like amidohydrolase
MLSGAGMKPADIIRAATLTSAEALGKEKDLGSVEEGKLADLLILEKNPIEDIQNLDSIFVVFKGGEKFDPKVLLNKSKLSNK